MAGLARIAREAGYRVGGCDKAFYPPMSGQLEQMGIACETGFGLPAKSWDRYIIGNALTRGNELVEAILDRRLPFASGPQWLYEAVLCRRQTLCVAGTHGKTTTSAMLAWILEFAGVKPGFLIGGVPGNFGVSSRLGRSSLFVIEGDEYDTAFFDKRSKFLHYRPQILVLNNLEFDHADIFPGIEAVKVQFHHLMRTMPGRGLVVMRAGDAALRDVIDRGCWCDLQTFGFEHEAADWQLRPSAGGFEVLRAGTALGVCRWDVPGEHNALNALAAVAAASRAGVDAATALEALRSFRGVARRLQVSSRHGGVTVYDDFAHHPTEIKASIAALRSASNGGRLIAVVEPRSNTMKLGRHNAQLAAALDAADEVFFYEPPDLQWSPDEVVAGAGPPFSCHKDIAAMSRAIAAAAKPRDKILVMSNGDFGNICRRIGELLRQRGPK